jgi:hypothetical protein
MPPAPSKQFSYVFPIDQQLYTQKLELRPGRLVPVGPYVKMKQRLDDEQRTGERRRKKGGGCGDTPIIKFLGVRHMGVPKYIRWWLRLRRVEEWRGIESRHFGRGCGCVVKLKVAWSTFVDGVKVVRQA